MFRINPGYRQALIEASIVTNSALAAYSLQQEFGVQRPCRIASRIRRLPSRDPAGMGTECAKQHEGNWIDRCAPGPGRIYRTWQRDIAVRPDYIAPPNLKFHARTFWP